MRAPGRDRREFLKGAMAAAVVPALLRLPVGPATVTILHTNDTHSQLDPLPPGSRDGGLGGAARRATYIKQVRAENPNTLLVDSGDFFQGTPYFNFYRGEVEVKVMSALGYDVVNLGNHDFDVGVDGLVRALAHARFDLVSANYEIASASPLRPLVKPYVVRTLGGVRVGVFGLGIRLEGLVLDRLHPGVTYRDPLATARAVVARLREQEKADLVVCLSHLGNEMNNGSQGPTDQDLARAVPGIDLVVGGHTHTFMKEPVVIRQADGGQTLIFQVGKSGINVGRVDFTFPGSRAR